MFTATDPFFVFFAVTDFIFERLRTYAGMCVRTNNIAPRNGARHLISRGSLDSIERFHLVAAGSPLVNR